MVLVIVALLSAMVVMRWSGVQHRAVTESAIDKLTFLDQHMRSFARMQRTVCALSFEINKNRVRKIYHAKDNKNPAWEGLGRGVEIDEIRTTGKRRRSKLEDVLYGPDGTSVTYVVHLTCPGNKQIWILFVGVTGQMTRLETEREADAALALINPATRI